MAATFAAGCILTALLVRARRQRTNTGLYAGVDIGGTTVTVGILDRNGAVHARVIGHVVDRTPAGVVGLVGKLYRQACSQLPGKRSTIVAAGIGIPGIIEAEKGFVKAMGNYNWKDVFVGRMLAREMGVPVVMENDANAALLGEIWTGAAKGTRNAILITLGTGIGGAIVSDGRLIGGATGMAGEIGHMILIPGGRLSETTGVHGVWEQYASASSVGKRGTEITGETLTCKDVFDRANSQTDTQCMKLVDETARHIAIGCINMTRVFDPEAILLSGGMTYAGKSLLDRVNRHYKELFWTLSDPAFEISYSALGNDAGMIGACSKAVQAVQQGSSMISG